MPNQGEPLSTQANVVVNKITNAHRFVLTATGILPSSMEAYKMDIIRCKRSKKLSRTHFCTLQTNAREH